MSKMTYKKHLYKGLPFAEDRTKFKEKWGPDECIRELQRIVEENPEQVITRNFFRVNSNISEATWNRYFGTFLEFKRQAGITLTRQQAAVERAIAKHASVDHYEELNKRQDWGDDYKHESVSPDKTILVLSDLHDKQIDPFYLRVALDTARRLNPTDICLNGDIYDVPEFGSYAVDPRYWDPAGRIRFVQEEILLPLRNACPDARIDLIEGNHEFRLIREGSNFTAALAVFKENIGQDLRDFLGLSEYEINYYSKANSKAFTKGDIKKELGNNWKVYYDCVLSHHFPIGEKWGMPGWNGHHHKHIVKTHFSPSFGSYEWHQIGAGHIRSATYTNADIMWSNGFLIAYVHPATRTSTFEYVQITDTAMVGGKFYKRQNDEY